MESGKSQEIIVSGEIIVAILWSYQDVVAFWSCWYHTCFRWSTVECHCRWWSTTSIFCIYYWSFQSFLCIKM